MNGFSVSLLFGKCKQSEEKACYCTAARHLSCFFPPSVAVPSGSSPSPRTLTLGEPQGSFLGPSHHVLSFPCYRIQSCDFTFHSGIQECANLKRQDARNSQMVPLNKENTADINRET